MEPQAVGSVIVPHRIREEAGTKHSIIYLVGLIVVVLAVLSLFGLA